MAVPQLQLANLGDIFARSQMQQAQMDTNQLQQLGSLLSLQKLQKASEDEAKLKDLLGQVDITTPEGAKALAKLNPQMGIGLLEKQSAINANKAKADLAQQRATLAEKQFGLQERNINSQIANRGAQLALNQAQERRIAAQAKRQWGPVGFGMAQKIAQGLAALPEEQRPAAYLDLKARYGDMAPELFQDEQYSPEMAPAIQALANAGQKKSTGKPVPVVDPATGKTVYAAPDEAVGKQAPDQSDFKEFQYTAAQYGQRMKSASENMSQFDNPSALEKAFQKSGILGNFAQTPERQMYYQAQREFINAIKRKESGAAVSESEVEDYAQTYFPQPGDDQKVIAQKRRARDRAIAGLKAQAGGAWKQVEGAIDSSSPAPAQGGIKFLGFE